MYQLSRLLLVVAVLAGFYSLAIIVWLAWPASGWLLALLAFGRMGRKGYVHLTTLASGRWANERDLRKAKMLNATTGLILGRLQR
jgi:hypothetical protein